MPFKKLSAVALPLFLLAPLISAPASAIPISYSYASDTLSPSSASGIPAVTNMTLTFTADLAAGLGGADSTASLTEWAISDGFTTASSAASDFNVIDFNVWTDSSAIVTSFIFSARNSSGTAIALGENYQMQMDVDPTSQSSDSIYCGYVNPNTETCLTSNWSSSTTVTGGIDNGGDIPTPATLALFGLGLAGLGISRRKRITQG